MFGITNHLHISPEYFESRPFYVFQEWGDNLVEYLKKQKEEQEKQQKEQESKQPNANKYMKDAKKQMGNNKLKTPKLPSMK